MFLNPGFKMTTRFANVDRTTASTNKFMYQERFDIVRNMVIKISLMLKFFFVFKSFESFSFKS